MIYLKIIFTNLLVLEFAKINNMDIDNKQDDMIDSSFEWIRLVTSDKLIRGKWKIVKSDDPNLKLELNK